MTKKLPSEFCCPVFVIKLTDLYIFLAKVRKYFEQFSSNKYIYLKIVVVWYMYIGEYDRCSNKLLSG